MKTKSAAMQYNPEWGTTLLAKPSYRLIGEVELLIQLLDGAAEVTVATSVSISTEVSSSLFLPHWPTLFVLPPPVVVHGVVESGAAVDEVGVSQGVLVWAVGFTELVGSVVSQGVLLSAVGSTELVGATELAGSVVSHGVLVDPVGAVG